MISKVDTEPENIFLDPDHC